MIKIEEPDKIVDFAEEILKSLIDKIKRKRTKNPNTRSKISRLPISLAQLKAGNNSTKLNHYCILYIIQKI